MTKSDTAGARTQAVVDEIRAAMESRGTERTMASRVGIERALTETRRLSKVTAHWGIAPSWPAFGRIEVLAKRAMRIGFRWYINPIVDQQNSFNLAVLAALYEIEAHLDALESEMSQDTSSNGDGREH